MEICTFSKNGILYDRSLQKFITYEWGGKIHCTGHPKTNSPAKNVLLSPSVSKQGRYTYLLDYVRRNKNVKKSYCKFKIFLHYNRLR